MPIYRAVQQVKLCHAEAQICVLPSSLALKVKEQNQMSMKSNHHNTYVFLPHNINLWSVVFFCSFCTKRHTQRLSHAHGQTQFHKTTPALFSIASTHVVTVYKRYNANRLCDNVNVSVKHDTGSQLHNGEKLVVRFGGQPHHGNRTLITSSQVSTYLITHDIC